jgi:hypothetical protein
MPNISHALTTCTHFFFFKSSGGASLLLGGWSDTAPLACVGRNACAGRVEFENKPRPLRQARENRKMIARSRRLRERLPGPLFKRARDGEAMSRMWGVGECPPSWRGSCCRASTVRRGRASGARRAQQRHIRCGAVSREGANGRPQWRARRGLADGTLRLDRGGGGGSSGFVRGVRGPFGLLGRGVNCFRVGGPPPGRAGRGLNVFRPPPPPPAQAAIRRCRVWERVQPSAQKF